MTQQGVRMEGFKEFQGKDLDSAIEEACGYFNTAREKLEIEIVQDAKSGIFGIVGARKAKVRARRVQLREAMESILGRKNGEGASAPAPSAGQPASASENAGSVEQRKNGGNRQEQAPTAAPESSAPSAPKAPVAPTAPEVQAEKGRGDGRDRQQEARPQRNQQDDRRNQQDDRRNRGRNRKPQSLDAFESEEELDAAINGNVLDKPADRPFDRRGERNGKPDRNGAKPSGRNSRNDRGRERTGRNAEGEGVEAVNPAETPAREARGRRNDSRSDNRPDNRSDNRPDSRGNGRAEVRSPQRENNHPERAPRSDAPVDGLEDDFEAAGEGLPVTPLEQLDAAKLEALVDETVRKLIRPITGDGVGITVKIGGGRVYVGIDCDEDSGLLIGREGQTLAALQYMISRIVSRGMNAAVRVQLDAGEYRRRQDEKLREMALALADKVRQSGRSYSTRPLSSYHRRIVHVCLQEAVDVQTRSTGDGPMKRVVIMRRKGERV